MAKEIVTMRLRSEEPQNEQMHQPVCTSGTPVVPKDQLLNGPMCMNQIHGVVPGKDDEADCDSDKEFAASSASDADSEEFDCAASDTYTSLLNRPPMEASSEPRLLAHHGSEISNSESDVNEDGDVEDLDDEIQKSDSNKRQSSKRKRLFTSSSSSDEDNTSNSPVSVRCAKKKEDNTRVYDKRQACYYCGALLSKIARHYELKHQSEREVAIALSFNKGSPTRKKHLEKLRLLGNYHHNLTVLETGKGELVVLRRPSCDKACNPSDFLPCNYCLGFIKRQELWKHVKSCKFKPQGENPAKYQKVQEKAKQMLYPAIYSDESTSILSKLFTTMKNDQVSLVARNDWLIKEIGVLLVEKHGEKQNNFVSQKMRELARLLLQLREEDFNPNAQLSDFIKPAKFDIVVSAVKVISKFYFEAGVQNVATPSLSLKIGHSLKKCVNILRGNALRRKDKEVQEDVDNFEKLLESEWSHRVSHHSLGALGTRKFNKAELLPLAEDLEKLRKSVLSKMSSSAQVLQEQQPQLEVWSQLAQAALARLVMFNKRRGGEASKMLVESYLNRPDWTQVNNPEIMSTLSAFERELSKRLDMVEIRGKRGRKVPVILTGEMISSIDLLIKTRKAVGIPDGNPYVFARPNRQSLEYMRSWDCLRKFSAQCEPPLSNPANITSTKLRKYIATISQVLSMEEREVDWLARHLGHDIRVHRDFYRLHESTIEIAKVSKLLLTVDQGETSKFAGRSLEEIDLNEIEDPDLSDTDCELDDDDDDTEVKERSCSGIADAECSNFNETLDNDGSSTKNGYRQISSNKKRTRTGRSQKDIAQEKENTNSAISETKKRKVPENTQKRSKDTAKESGHCLMPKSKKSIIHTSWTEEEKQAVFKSLDHWIRQGGRLPGKLDCEKCISKANGALDRRKWSDVKYFVKNQIEKRKRVLAPKNENE